MARRVVLVTGPPCAGKTTHVAMHAEPGDAVLDQDTIGATAMRQGLAQVAAMRDGTAWVIRCAPGPAARAALARQIRATELVHLDVPRAELIHRAARRPNRRRHIAAVDKWLTAEATDAPPRATSPPRTRQGGTSAGRRGRAHRKAKQDLHNTTQMCWLCGHSGAYELDHEPPRATLLQLGLDPDDPRYHRAAHGTSCPCPTCGQQCNQVKGVSGQTRMTCEW